MHNTLTIQRATAADAERITNHRYLMFVEIGGSDPKLLSDSLPLFTTWVRGRLANGEYIGLMAMDGDMVAASAGLWRMAFLPGPMNLSGERAYILNVYTDPAYRGRGLAKKLVSQLVDEAQALGLHVIELHASNAGRPIYESIGFEGTNQMRLYKP